MPLFRHMLDYWEMKKSYKRLRLRSSKSRVKHVFPWRARLLLRIIKICRTFSSPFVVVEFWLRKQEIKFPTQTGWRQWEKLPSAFEECSSLSLSAAFVSILLGQVQQRLIRLTAGCHLNRSKDSTRVCINLFLSLTCCDIMEICIASIMQSDAANQIRYTKSLFANGFVNKQLNIFPVPSRDRPFVRQFNVDKGKENWKIQK